MASHDISWRRRRMFRFLIATPAALSARVSLASYNMIVENLQFRKITPKRPKITTPERNLKFASSIVVGSIACAVGIVFAVAVLDETKLQKKQKKVRKQKYSRHITLSPPSTRNC